jgi:RimJ/RimL family protein N-acetyltransferase
MKQSHSGKLILNHLKTKSGLLPDISIMVGNPAKYVLRTIPTNPDFLNQSDIKYLTEWRNRFVKSFLTEFQATEPQTEKWLTETVRHNENKILFMLDSLEGESFGYMGLDFIDWSLGYAEADAIVRGREAAPGTMKLALQTLLNWGRHHLELSIFGVRVRSDNTALKFYEKSGFEEVRRLPLRKIEEIGITRWVEEEETNSNVSLVQMRYRL